MWTKFCLNIASDVRNGQDWMVSDSHGHDCQSNQSMVCGLCNQNFASNPSTVHGHCNGCYVDSYGSYVNFVWYKTCLYSRGVPILVYMYWANIKPWQIRPHPMSTTGGICQIIAFSSKLTNKSCSLPWFVQQFWNLTRYDFAIFFNRLIFIIFWPLLISTSILHLKLVCKFILSICASMIFSPNFEIFSAPSNLRLLFCQLFTVHDTSNCSQSTKPT